MLILKQWEEFAVLSDEEYRYLCILMKAYNKPAVHPFIDVMQVPNLPTGNNHLVHVEFFIGDLRMLKLAHISIEDKNHKFMQDICEIVEARCPQGMVDILNDPLYQ